MRKKTICIMAVVILLGFYAGINATEYSYYLKEEKERQLQEQFDHYAKAKEEDYVYPQENEWDEGISKEYTAGVLTKLSEGRVLTEAERTLVDYHKIQTGGYGIAVTRFLEHDGGMGKRTRRIWETADAGQNWNVLEEESYSTGVWEFTYMDNVFIEAGFAATAEEGFFYISEDRGHSYTSLSYSDVFKYDGVAYAEKLAENEEEKTVTYKWIDFYTREHIATVEYDMQMKAIKHN